MDLVDALMASIKAEKARTEATGSLTERIEEMKTAEVA